MEQERCAKKFQEILRNYWTAQKNDAMEEMLRQIDELLEKAFTEAEKTGRSILEKETLKIHKFFMDEITGFWEFPEEISKYLETLGWKVVQVEDKSSDYFIQPMK